MTRTVTTEHGLVHAVKYVSGALGHVTICRRAYVASLFDEPARVVTCVWCIVGKPWPADLSLNPCGEIEIDALGPVT